MYALLTAGGTPEPGDALYEYTRGLPKAMLDVNGKPMVQWVLDALSDSPSVEHIIIAGLTPDCNIDLSSRKPLTFLANHGGLLQNLRAGVLKVAELDPRARYVLAVASDIPAVTREMIEWTAQSALESDRDIHYTVITRKVMESRYPGSKRSYIRFKDYEVCGGDMNVLRVSTVLRREALWEKLIASRKNILGQAAILGFDLLVLIFLRLITLESAAKLISRRLMIDGRAVLCPFAETGMDVDKPHQLDIIRADLERRVRFPPGEREILDV